jgi:subtilisin-like proprotein convertase family protein
MDNKATFAGLAVLSFAQICSAGLIGPGFIIPDNNPNGASSTIIDEHPGLVLPRLTVLVDLSHTWASDLICTLTHDDGTTVRTAYLFNRIGRTQNSLLGYSSDFVGGQGYVFEDGYNNLWTAAAMQSGIPGGSIAGGFYAASTNLFGFDVPSSYQPVNLDATFAGQRMAGSWTLWISDNRAGQTGELLQWSYGFSFPAPSALSLFGFAAAGKLTGGRRRRLSP